MAKIWFGNTRHAEYIEAPVSGMEASSVGVSNTLQFLNGGAYVSSSPATHREYDMEWSVTNATDLHLLTDLHSGTYGRELVYWADPFAQNVLPPHWSVPSLTADGWPSIITPGYEPAVIDTVFNNKNYPTQTAVFTPPGPIGSVPARSLTLLVPVDRVLHVGFVGVSNGAIVRAVCDKRTGGTDTFTVGLSSVTAGNILNNRYAGSQYSAVHFTIVSTVLNGSLSLTYGAASYARPSEQPSLGQYVTGWGHTGLRFEGPPTMTYIQSVGRKRMVSAAAKLIEVEAWL